MNNFSHATEATETALNSAGSAARENSAYMEGLEAKTTQLRASFQELANNIINSDLVKNILDLANGFLQMANTPLGQFVTQVTLLGTALGSISALIGKFYIGPAVSGLTNLISGLIGVVPAAAQAKGGLTGLGAVLLKMPGWLKAVGVGVTVLGTIFGGLIFPKIKEWWEDTHPTLEQVEQDISDLNTELNNNKQKLQDLEAIPYPDRTTEQQAEIDRLKETNAELEKQLELLEQQRQTMTLDEMRSGTEFKSKSGKQYELRQWGSYGTQSQSDVIATTISQVKDLDSAYEEMINTFLAYANMSQDTFDQLRKDGLTVQEIFAQNQYYVQDAGDAYLSLDESLEKYTDTINKANGYIQNGIGVTGQFRVVFNESAEQLVDFANTVDDSNIALSNLSEAERAAYEMGKKLQEQGEDTETIWGDMTNAAYGLAQGCYNLEDGTLITVDAVDGMTYSLAQATAGMGLTRSQVEMLTSEYPSLNFVVNENTGLYELNTEALYDAANAGDSYAQQTIAAQKAATESTIANVKQRIEAIRMEMDLLSRQSNMNMELARNLKDVNLDKSIEYENLGRAQAKAFSSWADEYNVAWGDLEKLQAGLASLPSGYSGNKSNYSPSGGGVTTSGGSSSRSSAKETDPIEAQNEKYEEQNSILERQIELAKARGASEEELLALNTQYQNQLHEQAEWFRAHGVDESSEYITDRSLQWLELQQEKADLVNQSYEDQIASLEHQRDLLENQGADAQVLVKINKQIQALYHKQAEELRKMGYAEDSEEIMELQNAWWDLENENTDISRQAFDDRLAISENYIEQRNFYNDWGADSEIDAWQRVLDWMEDMYEQGLIDAEYYYEKREEIMKKYHTAEQKEIERIQQLEEQRHQAVIDALEENIGAVEDMISDLEDVASDYERAFSYVAERAQEEIDALEEKKQSVEDYYDKQIEALQETNDELEDQITLEEKLDALARAKQQKVLVYRNGRYQYLEDVDVVSDAQADLEEYNREQQLQDEIDRLEQLKEQEIASIQEQIDWWEEYKEQWASIVDNYEKEQDRLLAEQILGTNLEGDNWEKRLGNAEDFVVQYEDLMNRITEAKENQLEALKQQLEEEELLWEKQQAMKDEMQSTIEDWKNQASGSDSNRVSDVNNALDNLQNSFNNLTGKGSGSSSGGKGSSSGGSVVGSVLGGVVSSIGSALGAAGSAIGSAIGGLFGGKHANGTMYAQGGLSLVGEKGPELRVLGKGDGILPNEITKNLWKWGEINPSALTSSFSGINNDREQIVNISIQNFNPNLPGVVDGEGFANYMKENFFRETLQFAHRI